MKQNEHGKYGNLLPKLQRKRKRAQPGYIESKYLYINIQGHIPVSTKRPKKKEKEIKSNNFLFACLSILSIASSCLI